MTALLAQAADPETVRRTAEDVLSQAEYSTTTGPSLLDRMVGYVLEQLGRLLLQFDGDGGSGSVLASVALVGVVVGLLVAIVWFVLRLRRAAPLDAVVEGPVGRPARSWADEAARHEQAGELREALRCRYRETVARLAATGLVDEVPGRTTGEYLAATRTAVPAAGEPFERLTRHFEEAWYGRADVTADRLADVRGLQGRVLDVVPRRLRGRAEVDAGDRDPAGVG